MANINILGVQSRESGGYLQYREVCLQIALNLWIQNNLSSSAHVHDQMFFSFLAVKSKFVASVSIDEIYTNLSNGRRGQFAANTDLPIYLGSLPPNVPNFKTIQRTQYVGCMRNLQLNGVPESFTNGKTSGNVLSSSCHID